MKRARQPRVEGSWLPAIAWRGVVAAIFWWFVVATWFSWVTTIFLVFAPFATAVFALVLWAAGRDARGRV